MWFAVNKDDSPVPVFYSRQEAQSRVDWLFENLGGYKFAVIELEEPGKFGITIERIEEE